MSRITEHLHLDAMTVTGKTLGENIAGAEVYNDDVIRTVANPIYREGALAVLKGNLAPDGCVIKPSACEPRFLKHTGPALVFDDYPSIEEGNRRSRSRRIGRSCADPAPCRAAGRSGHAGMGHAADPDQAGEAGRARHGAAVGCADERHQLRRLHFACGASESYIGGPLALVRNGDRITLDVAARTIKLDVPETELASAAPNGNSRRAASSAGYGWMFSKHIKQATEGCDFDFLETGFGAPVGEPSIY